MKKKLLFWILPPGFVFPPDMSRIKVSFVLFKRFFDMGLAITNYFKYLIAFFGIASHDLQATMILGVSYAFFCLGIGWAWHRFGLMEMEIEVANLFNIFVKEMRQKVK